MTTKSREKHVTKRELVSAFWRSFLITACFSMDRMQAPGFDYAMIPVLKKLYGDDKEALSEALTRHAEAYNNTYACTPLWWGSPVPWKKRRQTIPPLIHPPSII